MTITQANYFDTVNRFGISALPEALKAGHEVVEEATEKGKNWKTGEPDIDELIDLQIEKLDEWVDRQEGNNEPDIDELIDELDDRGGFKIPAVAAKKLIINKVPAATTKKSGNRSTAKKAVSARPAKKGGGGSKAKAKPAAVPTKAKVVPGRTTKKAGGIPPKKKAVVAKAKKAEPKPGVSVKKMSAELSFIKSYKLSRGKNLSKVSLQRRIAAMEKVEHTFTDHKTLLSEILTGYKRGVDAIQTNKLDYVTVMISDAFFQKCEDAVKNAKVKLRVDYLGGVNKVENLKFHVDKEERGALFDFNIGDQDYSGGILEFSDERRSPRVDYDNEVPENWEEIEEHLIKEYYSAANKQANGKKLSGVAHAKSNPVKPIAKRKKASHLGSIATGEEIVNADYPSIDLGPYAEYFGKPAGNFDMMVFGEPRAGKTYDLLGLANYLAENVGRTHFVSAEEYGARTLADKIQATGATSPNLSFSRSLTNVDLSKIDFLFLDSINALKMTLDQYRKLRDQYPHLGVVIILQKTKNETFRGGKDWEHEVEICVEYTKDVDEDDQVVGRYRNVYNSRYDHTGMFEI